MNTIMLALVADIVGSMLLILMLEAIHFFAREDLEEKKEEQENTKISINASVE